MFALVFMFYGGFTVNGQAYIKRTSERECGSTTTHYADLDRIYFIAETLLCTSECPCNADPNDWPDEYRSRIITDMENGASNAKECSGFSE